MAAANLTLKRRCNTSGGWQRYHRRRSNAHNHCLHNTIAYYTARCIVESGSPA